MCVLTLVGPPPPTDRSRSCSKSLPVPPFTTPATFRAPSRRRAARLLADHAADRREPRPARRRPDEPSGDRSRSSAGTPHRSRGDDGRVVGHHAHRIAGRVDRRRRRHRRPHDPHEVHWIRVAPRSRAPSTFDRATTAARDGGPRTTLGRSPRHPVPLHLDGSADTRPRPGDTVTGRWRAVGRIGSTVDHFELISPALVKRGVDETTELAVTVDDESVAASVDRFRRRAPIRRRPGSHRPTAQPLSRKRGIAGGPPAAFSDGSG